MPDDATKLKHLIALGEDIAIQVQPPSRDEEEATLRHTLDPASFQGWSLRCSAVLHEVLPAESPRRFLLEKLGSLDPGPEAQAYMLEQLRELLSQLESGSSL